MKNKIDEQYSIYNIVNLKRKEKFQYPIISLKLIYKLKIIKFTIGKLNFLQ
jgi:hypothetical protein